MTLLPIQQSWIKDSETSSALLSTSATSDVCESTEGAGSGQAEGLTTGIACKSHAQNLLLRTLPSVPGENLLVLKG